MGDFEKLFGNLRDAILTWLKTADPSQILVALALFLVVFIFRKSLTSLILKFMGFIARTIQISIDDTVKKAIFPAVKALLLSLTAYGLLETLNLPTLLNATIERLVISIAIASVFAAGYTLVDTMVGWMISSRDLVRGIQLDWLKKVLKAATVLLGLTAILKVWEIDIGPVLTGMGVLGAGVALAAQDIFRNLIAGMASMSEKRFEIGEWVQVEGVVEGIVEKVELRSTLVRRFDQAPVHVPNADLANSTLINFTRRPYRRIQWTVQVVYSTTAEQLLKIRDTIEDYINTSGDFAPPDRASRYIRIDSFDDSSINIIVWCFTNTTDFSAYLASKERLLLKIKEAVEASGTTFAFPTRSVHVSTDSSARPVDDGSGMVQKT